MANDSAQYQPADSGLANGHPSHSHETRPAPAPPITANMKKGKAKKPADSSETSKLLAARISQLELDAAGEKDLEAEIGTFFPKAFVMAGRFRHCQRVNHFGKFNLRLTLMNFAFYST